MGKVAGLLFWCGLVLLIVSFWNRNQFPDDIQPVALLHDEPRQSLIQQSPFSVQYENTQYDVEPQYDYDIHGLVVSYKHHNGNSMLHKLWNDHLNMTDVCIVWGETAINRYLNEFDFWNGQFTCNFKTRNNVAWSSFNQNQISNNHLLSNDDVIRKKVQQVKIGDQIRIKGYLSSYGAKGGGKRGTSTVRTDTGNGACETIFIKEFDIVREGKNGWRTIMYFSLFLLVFALVMYIASPYKVN
ncbi:MAG: hypothetical protein ACRBCI_04970 [Cellvibrionaceae bacterium]